MPATEIQNSSPDPRRQLVNEIISKALNDSTFKEELISNPKESLYNSFNVKLPENVEVVVVEETPTKVYLVIPFCPDQDCESEDNNGPHW